MTPRSALVALAQAQISMIRRRRAMIGGPDFRRRKDAMLSAASVSLIAGAGRSLARFDRPSKTEAARLPAKEAALSIFERTIDDPPVAFRKVRQIIQCDVLRPVSSKGCYELRARREGIAAVV